MPLTNPDKFSLMLHALLNIPPTQPLGFTLKETDTELVLTGQNITLLKKLQALLNTEKDLRTALPYTLTRTTSASASAPMASQASLSAAPRPTLTGKNLFNLLFSEELSDRIGKGWSSSRIVDDGITMTAPFNLNPRHPNGSLVEHQIQQYQKVLASATKEALLAAVADQNPTPLSFDLDATDSPAAAPAGFLSAATVAQLLSAKRVGGEDKVYFCHALFWQYLFPSMSVPLTIENHEGTFTLRINKRALLIFLSTTIREGFILSTSPTPSSDTSSSRTHGRPICFRPPNDAQPDLHLAILLDCSGSMNDVFSEYMKQVSNFINALRSKSPHAEVHLIPFGCDEKIKPLETKISETAQIDRWLKRLYACAHTPLFETLTNALTQLNTSPRIQHMNKVLLLFTDGVDTGEETHQRKLTQYMQDIRHTTNAPRCYTLGLGVNYQNNPINMQELSSLTRAKHIPLQRMEDFSVILNEIAGMQESLYQMRFSQADNSFEIIFSERNGIGAAEAHQTVLLSHPMVVDGTSYQAHMRHASTSSIFSRDVAAAEAPRYDGATGYTPRSTP